MLQKLFYILIALCLMSQVNAAEHRFDRFGCTMDIPAGWDIDSALTDEIVLYDSNDNLIEILIKKYPLDSYYQLEDEGDLREALAGLYQDLGVEEFDPESIPYTLRQDRALFGIEYVEEDLNFNELVRHYIEGIIVRTKKQGQVLFLLSAKAPMAKFENIQEEARSIFGSFQITEPLESNLFVEESSLGMTMLFVVIVLMAFFYFRNRKIQRSRHPLGRESSHYWRCHNCGLVNHIEHRQCNRCGVEHAPQHTP